MNNGILLLKTLLLSTSARNILRHSKDKKKRNRAIMSGVGVAVLYLMVMVYSVFMCVGYGKFGMIQAVPVTCALTISVLAFVFTLFKTNGYLFNFKEYDMLMSLPFEAKTVAGCKFLYMAIKSLPWYVSISVAMMVGYGIYARPSVAVYPVWVVLSLLLPLIPMLIASFLGSLIAWISAGMRKTNIVQTLLMVLLVIVSFSLRFILEDLFENDRVEAALQSASRITGDAAGLYLPARWFSDAILKLSVSDMLLLAGTSILLFGVVFTLVGRSYRQINSALKSHAAARRFSMSEQKRRGPVGAIAYKEYKRFTGSSAYMVNAGMGEIMAALVGLLTLVIGPEKIVRFILKDAPLDPVMLRPAIPFMVYFFIGMMSTTVCSPSLEGKNYWIIQSLPIEKRNVYQGKMLFNLLLTVPFMAFTTLCICVAGGVPVLDTLLYLLLGLALCAFSTAWGCVIGVKHLRLDWENEVEVIKQGSAMAIYMFPNMLVVIALTVATVILGTRVDSRLTTLGFTLIAALLAALSYRRVMSLARRG